MASFKGLLFYNKTPKITLVDEDPDDDKFIARLLKAEVITETRPAIKEHMKIKILTPAQFLKYLEEDL
jgi:hypothetical protein